MSHIYFEIEGHDPVQLPTDTVEQIVEAQRYLAEHQEPGLVPYKVTTQFLGTADDVNTCDCCGKSGLKHTVVLDRDGETVYFGSTCAARALAMPATEVRAQAKAAHAEQVEIARRFDLVLNAERYAIEAQRVAEESAWIQWLNQQCAPGEIRGTVIVRLGLSRNAFHAYVLDVYGPGAERARVR